MKARCGLFVPALASLVAAAPGHAAQPAPHVDAELLEFLGSLDTEDEAWQEFLADRPIRPEAGKPASKPAASPVAKDNGKKPPATQQDKAKTP